MTQQKWNQIKILRDYRAALQHHRRIQKVLLKIPQLHPRLLTKNSGKGVVQAQKCRPSLLIAVRLEQVYKGPHHHIKIFMAQVVRYTFTQYSFHLVPRLQAFAVNSTTPTNSTTNLPNNAKSRQLETRQRQLDMLKRMEERYRNITSPQKPPQSVTYYIYQIM